MNGAGVLATAALLAAPCLCACANGERGPDFPTSSSFPTTPRKPPSFASDAALQVEPEPTGTARPVLDHSRPLRVTLPPDPEAAKALVSRFFLAVLLESSSDLFPLFANQAWVVSEGSRQSAQSAWRARLAALDYTAMAGRLVATPQSLRTYTIESAARAKRDGAPVPATPQEIVILARPSVSWLGKQRLFGDTLAFRLREKPEDSGFEITEIAEDFRLP